MWIFVAAECRIEMSVWMLYSHVDDLDKRMFSIVFMITYRKAMIFDQGTKWTRMPVYFDSSDKIWGPLKMSELKDERVLFRNEIAFSLERNYVLKHTRLKCKVAVEGFYVSFIVHLHINHSPFSI